MSKHCLLIGALGVLTLGACNGGADDTAETAESETASETGNGDGDGDGDGDGGCAEPGVFGDLPTCHTVPPADSMTSALTCLAWSHISSSFDPHWKWTRTAGIPYASFTPGSISTKFVALGNDGT